MENKHFEPVTAMDLAKRIFAYTVQRSYNVDRISEMIEPHIRKPSDEDKSVPARCEEAYNEAISLLHGAWNTIRESGTGSEIENWRDRAAKLMGGPNPFKEADIAKEDETEPTLLPFSLEDAKNGAKVVTTKGDDVKIVADDLTGNFPLLAVVTTAGVKVSCRYSIDGSTEGQHPPMDLFILKEPETVEVSIYKNKYADLYLAATYDEHPATRFEKTNYELIKTIKVTI